MGGRKNKVLDRIEIDSFGPNKNAISQPPSKKLRARLVRFSDLFWSSRGAVAYSGKRKRLVFADPKRRDIRLRLRPESHAGGRSERSDWPLV